MTHAPLTARRVTKVRWPALFGCCCICRGTFRHLEQAGRIPVAEGLEAWAHVEPCINRRSKAA